MLHVLLAMLACSGDDSGKTGDGDPPEATGDTSLIGDTAVPAITLGLLEPADSAVHFARILYASVGLPTFAVLRIDDGEQVREITFPDLATEHHLPILGMLANTPHTLHLTLTTEEGDPFEATTTVEIPTPDLPLPSTLVSGTGTPEPGWTLLGLGAAGVADVVAIYDEKGRPRWARQVVDDVKGARFTPEGVLGFKVGFGLTTMGILGSDRVVYHADDQGPGWVDVVPELFHHDMHVLPDGSLLGLSKLTRQVTDLPSSYDLDGTTTTADIIDDQIVHLAADGTVLEQWSTVDLLSTSRIGWDSLEPGPNGDIDWGHTNAVSFPDDDTLLISVRHQDAVVAIERNTGAVRWILANPTGWPAPLEALRLQPIGTVGWQFHQHGPDLKGDLLTVFDNGANARTTPYDQTPDPRGNYSRVVQYRIDETAGTVEETFSFILGDTGTRGLYAPIMGDADQLPGGHILATWASVTMQEDGPNTANGRGDVSARVVELDPVSGSVVWDLSVFSDAAVHPKGWVCDQADRVGSLYSGIATERVLP